MPPVPAPALFPALPEEPSSLPVVELVLHARAAAMTEEIARAPEKASFILLFLHQVRDQLDNNARRPQDIPT